ncbi:TIGR02186 family protein [Kaistia geumhonensis]|uniref:Uncharacterized protein (TIGR02186 family) n=1 Tax=Kaistia geumhonensis TaxID=410839 RepID=A0ABU0M6C5_9HYPH|nr:TIGR02186 family protein [Kaistia geumhonensis]MCX5478407.1 TIGR02186 family protein [Kaistia geumhonensis]MDQ0516375.1 uncharacterized protein (TIGR02186 family) [Kaistia geumhonensis]
MRPFTRHAVAAAVLLAALLALPARAERLVVAASTDHVRISSSFTGTSLAVFGAIEAEEGSAERAPYEVVVVVRGPDETLVTRRKDRVAGIWLNRASRVFADMPSFYAVSASRPLDEIADTATLRRYEIGLDHLDFGPADRGDDSPEEAAFRAAFVRLKEDAGLYRQTPFGVTFPGVAVFQSSIELPANVPVGTYRVSVFLFRDGAMLTTNGADFSIAKSGFEQFTFTLANTNGLVYGLICVMLALLTGWLAGVLFRRD